jgi:phosphohistidine phosphatase SixA
MRRPLLLVLLCAFAAAASAEPPTIFLVRHAERADAGGAPQNDPDLSEAGRGRAAALAETLRDAKISAIYVTEFRRTQETARPLAEKLKIQPVIIPAKEAARLFATLKSAKGNVLVVGHSNTVPEIMRALGVAAPPVLGERDYDDLFLLTRAPVPHLVHLHYR